MGAVPVRRLHAQRWRPLTAGEIAMASLLFRDAIDYTHVRILGRRYLPFQPKNCCMTPNGSMYFHASCFLDDYSRANLTGQHWFIHEMVQKYLHQMQPWARLAKDEQERIIGREIVSNVELLDATSGQKSHKTLATIVDDDGTEHDICATTCPSAAPARANMAPTSSATPGICG